MTETPTLRAGRGRLQRLCGVLGLAGAMILVAGNIAGTIVVDSHDPIRETVSDLAAGPNAWIQDIALNAFAIGLAALGAGLALMGHADTARWRWFGAVALLGLLAADVVLIAEYEAYGALSDPKATEIHVYLVILLAIAAPAAMALSAAGLSHAGPGWGRFSLAMAALWLVVAPPFFWMPTGIDGLYERSIGMIIVGWVAAVSWLVWDRAFE